MNIGITGGEGFLGKHLVAELEKRGVTYSLLDRTKHDLLDPVSLKSFVSGKNVVIHLAGINKHDNPAYIMQINAVGTKNIMQAIADYSPQTKIIFSSTFQIYIHNNIYGQSKRKAEKIISRYARRTPSEAIILRMTNIYGPGSKPFYNTALATFLYLLRNNKQVQINGDGSQTRDYLYVDDAVEAIIRSIPYVPSPIAYFDICTGTRTSLVEVLEIMKKATNKTSEICYNKDLKSDDWQLKKSYKKAKKLLGWEPKIDIQTGIAMYNRAEHYESNE